MILSQATLFVTIHQTGEGHNQLAVFVTIQQQGEGQKASIDIAAIHTSRQ